MISRKTELRRLGNIREFLFGLGATGPFALSRNCSSDDLNFPVKSADFLGAKESCSVPENEKGLSQPANRHTSASPLKQRKI